ncbi:MAG: nucleotide exchange factor GrpE [Rhizobiales bacterium]|nr:nucleotide exchange factor GrpE [Hyphomicrobiales bacterium]
MSDKDKPFDGPDDEMRETPEVSLSGWTETAMENEGELPPEDGEAEIDPVIQLIEDNADLKDQLLRAMAEMENMRRRTERQVKDANIYAVSNFARDTLTIGDNLERTLEAVPPEARAEGGALATLLDGVELTQRELQKTLEKHGVRAINPEGEKFDPNFHQAMFEIENPDIASGTVVQVAQTGYVIGERVLRPAMVGIAKGGPKFVTPANNDEATSDASQSELSDDMSRNEAAVRAEDAQAEAAKAKEPAPGSRIDKSA